MISSFIRMGKKYQFEQLDTWALHTVMAIVREVVVLCETPLLHKLLATCLTFGDVELFSLEELLVG